MAYRMRRKRKTRVFRGRGSARGRNYGRSRKKKGRRLTRYRVSRGGIRL